MPHFIELKNAGKIYNPGKNQVLALDGVSLTVERGEFVAIVGRSGSGKSTLMNLLGCLDLCTEGEYLIDGEDVSRMSDDELSELRSRQIGFVFQNFHLIPGMSAAENVELPLLYRGIGRERRRRLALSALEKVGLEDRLDHRPAQLSGGQQQRAAIARAIAASPPLLLADEPTGNLDDRSGSEVMEILQTLWQEGRTVILITHDPKIAQRAQRVVTISGGRVAGDVSSQSGIPPREPHKQPLI